MHSAPTHYTFIETTIFTKRLFASASAEVLEIIQRDLVENAVRGAVVKGLHGARKARVAAPATQRGKSGGLRYFYLFLPARDSIYLLFLFRKNEQDNLSPEQTKTLAKLVEAIKNQHEK